MSLSRVNAALKRNQVVDRIRQAILDGEFRPGDRLVEMTIARELGVSQTPVREALTTLSTEGLVVKSDHVGTFVSSLGQRELRELLTLRAELEGYCARLAAKRLRAGDRARLDELLGDMSSAARRHDMKALIESDLAFHHVLYAASGHDLLKEVLTGLQQRMQLALAVADAVYSSDLGDVADSHRSVIEALRSGDPAAAELAAREHVLSVLELLSTEEPAER